MVHLIPSACVCVCVCVVVSLCVCVCVWCCVPVCKFVCECYWPVGVSVCTDALCMCISSPLVTALHHGAPSKLVREWLTFPVRPPSLLLACLLGVEGCDASEDRLADECEEG